MNKLNFNFIFISKVPTDSEIRGILAPFFLSFVHLNKM